jgi:hypothetical protein
MLLAGINHVAVLTKDTERLQAFYREVFDATVFHDHQEGDLRLSMSQGWQSGPVDGVLHVSCT